MKKCLLLVLSFISINISAQVIVGGGIDFSASGGAKSTSTEMGTLTKSPVDFSFGFTPKVGYLINNFEVGLGVGLQYNHTMNYEILYNQTIEKAKAFKNYKDYTFNWSINPYARYRVVNAKGFGLWIEGIATFSTKGTEGRTYYAGQYGEDVLRTKEDAYKLNNPEVVESPIKTSVFYGGLYVQPVLTYNINDSWRLETTLNFLGLHLAGDVETIKNKETGEKVSYNTCTFGFNASTYNTFSVDVVGGLSSADLKLPFITIGATYSISNTKKGGAQVAVISELATDIDRVTQPTEADSIRQAKAQEKLAKEQLKQQKAAEKEQVRLQKLEEERLALEAIPKYIAQTERMHSIIVENRAKGGVVYNRYLGLYKGYNLNDDTAQTLIDIQKIVMIYINTQEPEALKNDIEKALTDDEVLTIFKKYVNK